ncbi:24018_t:CDS:10 [Dentiscutata erythropus]|uniref:24018_t:CDS:1 n=1 Tax=Dentiscutata erythropus TaxID=1348616 RepID=A0A9N9ADK3_9GLOM|nr:24018_t:CDS:10 [Dentiscutata erythropus]
MTSMKGRPLKPKEQYTHRLKNILEEYPDGFQILREILQNSDDSKRPALLSKNDTVFKERDFDSLTKLADSKKRSQFDNIGAMGVGFNSIYHITDSPTFITGDQYVILDPHEWYFDGGIRYNFIDDKIAVDYPDQLAPITIPFGIPFDQKLNGTIFRYPLRTIQDAKDSKILNKEYNPTKILQMFDKFYENESISCLLFLKSVESIKFYELKENENVAKLLCSIEIINVEQVREKRGLISENICSLMKDLDEKKLYDDTTLDSMFIMTFRQQKGDEKPRESQWIVFSFFGDLNATASYFKEGKIIEHKLIPNVGIAVQLNNPKAIGRLFCFLPLPILLPFHASVHGHFAVSTNRRSLWSAADGEELTEGSLSKLKVLWNKYLFDVILPQAWAKFLIKLPIEVQDIDSNNIYNFWPIIRESKFGNFLNQYKNLLLNTIENFNIKDKIFCGPPISSLFGNLSDILPSHNEASISCGTMIHLMSIENGFFPDESAPHISKILEKIGFPMINIDPKIYDELKKSRHKNSLNICSPRIIRIYLLQNKSKWESNVREDIISLFEYVLRDKNYTELNGLKTIPLSDGSFGTILHSETQLQSEDTVYIGPDDNGSIGDNDERKIFLNNLNKFVDKNITPELWDLLYKGTQEGWNLNIKMLAPSVVADLVTKELKGYSVGCDEIPMGDSCGLIFKIWANFKEMDYDLTYFENIHLLPTNNDTLRKLKTNQKCFWNCVDNNLDNEAQPLIEKFEVLACLKASTTFPTNIQIMLQPREAEIIINYLRRLHPDDATNDIVKYFPIFSEVGKEELIALLPNKRNWYLLPNEDEKDYGQIIAPNTDGFLDSSSSNTRFLLESVINVRRLSRQEYWTKFVIPYLENQPLATIEIIIIKLFERLQLLLLEDQNLKFTLENMAFVPASTNPTARENQETNFILKKPIDLFDPDIQDIQYISELFLNDEHSFPAGIFSEKFRDIFLTSLRTLGMKQCFSESDIIQRLDVFAKRKDNESDIVHQKSLKLVQYIDKNYEKLLGSFEYYTMLSLELLIKVWIPTIDSTGKKQFSRANECRSIKHKNLVGLVMPIIEYSFENSSFIKILQWDSYPSIDVVIAQLKACLSMVTVHENTFKICKEVYTYMNYVMSDNSSNLTKFKEKLKDEKWIYCNDKFYSTDQVVIELDKNLDSNTSKFVELPYTFKPYIELFKNMGVKQKMDITDLINIINEFQSTDATGILSNEELNKVIAIIKLVANRVSEQGYSCASIKDLLVPSTDCQLVNIYEIYFDDMKSRIDKNEKIVHSLISYSVAKTLGIKMLTGKFFDSKTNSSDDDDYEPDEELAVKIHNIINGYPLELIFNEILQNADDARARRICFIIDERDHRKPILNLSNTEKQNSLISDETNQWQGPALWIYNDSEFTPYDFESIKICGFGGKKDYREKNGRFRIGFNCVYHLTDFPSIVSGEHIIFFDPLKKFLPKTGNPPCSPHVMKFNFLEKKFKEQFEDQASTYSSFGCDFKKKFKGTLFRLPLRLEKSEISDQVLKSSDLINIIFKNIKANHEILFLRYIEHYSLFKMNSMDLLDLIWEISIQNINDIREFRISNSYETKLYQLEMEMCYKQSKFGENCKDSEIWIICSGGNDMIDKLRVQEISKEFNLSAKGGIAVLLSKRNNKSLEELKAEKFFNIQPLDGRIYSNLSLPIDTSFSVHINGTFCLSNYRKNILHADSNLSTKLNEWNRYILLDILPPLHAKLIEHIINQKMPQSYNQMLRELWPMPLTSDTLDQYREYGLNVLSNGGALTSLDKAYFITSNNSIIADILTNQGIEIVKLSEDKISQLNEMISKIGSSTKSIKLITPQSICSMLRNNSITLDILDAKNEKSHEIAIHLLNYIISNNNQFHQLCGIRLLPLCDKSLGTFGSQTYYIAEYGFQYLFPNAKAKFVDVLPFNLQSIFKDKNFCDIVNIKHLNANSIIDLLDNVLQRDKEMNWDPFGYQYPNKYWIDMILSKFTDPYTPYEFKKLARFPVIPINKPQSKLVLPDLSDPILIDISNHSMIPILAKFGVRFTDKKFPDDCNPFIKGCILQSSATNMITSLKKAIKKSSGSLNQLFSEKLDHNEIKIFRAFIKNEIRFIQTQEGIIPPQDIPLLSMHKETKFFLIESDSHRQALPLNVIPNYDFTKLVRANTLYSAANESLFRIFWKADKLLHPGLQENTRCLKALKIMGLKHQVNSATFLECVREINSKIQLQQPDDQIQLVKSDTIILMKYLNEHFTSLNFSIKQRKELIYIKFVPVDTDLESPLKETAVKTTGFESINSMCYQKYKYLCWTQCPLFLKSIDPPNIFKNEYPVLCRPTMNKVLDNLCYIAKIETYKTLDNWLKTSENHDKNMTILRLQKGAKIFLNSNDPFISEDWVAGENLVFGVQEDVSSELRKIHDNLKGFKFLLKVSGAKEIKNIDFNVKTQNYSQKSKLFGRLLNNFEKQDETRHHDVEFQIHHKNEIEKIYANRYVLSAASEHFETLFNGKMMEAAEYQKVTVDINDIKPSVFKVLVRWLYGQTLEEAIDAVLNHSKCSVTFLLKLLKASDKYLIDPLKYQVEVAMIKGGYIDIGNVVEINEWAKSLQTTQLHDYCNEYIKSNKSIVIEKKISGIVNANSEEDKKEEEDMLNIVLDS